MKRIVIILLVAVLMLSLAACGGGSSSNTTTGGSNDTPTTTPEKAAMTKEEMLEEAITVKSVKELNSIIVSTYGATSSYPYPQSYYELEIYALHKLNEQNPLTFAQEHLNKIYEIVGYVNSITSEYFVMNVSPDGGANTDLNMRIYPANQEEMLTIKTGDKVTIIGELITDAMIAKTGFPFYFHSAYIIAIGEKSLGIQTISGTILYVTKNPNYSNVLEALLIALRIERYYPEFLIQVEVPTDNDKYIWYNIYLSEEVANELQKNDKITVTGEAVPPPTIDANGKVINYAPLDRKYVALYYIIEPEVIEKHD